MFDGSEYISGKKTFTGVDQIFSLAPEISGAHFYLYARSGTQKIGGQKQSVRPIETLLETFLFVLYWLN